MPDGHHIKYEDGERVKCWQGQRIGQDEEHREGARKHGASTVRFGAKRSTATRLHLVPDATVGHLDPLALRFLVLRTSNSLSLRHPCEL